MEIQKTIMTLILSIHSPVPDSPTAHSDLPMAALLLAARHLAPAMEEEEVVVVALLRDHPVWMSLETR